MAEKARLTLDIDASLHRRLKIAAAQEGVTMRKFCLDAIERLLDADTAPRRIGRIGEEQAEYLTAKEAPLLAELWDNDEDAVYDDL